MTAPSQCILGAALPIDAVTQASEDTGMYFAEDNSLQGFIVPLPKALYVPRPRTEVDLVLPPIIAFCLPGNSCAYTLHIYINSFQGDDLPREHPILGKQSVQWSMVFSSIKQMGPLWDTWKPSKSLEKMEIQEVWNCYNTGEVTMQDGIQSGMKPPLQLVEQYFKSEWRKGSTVSTFLFYCKSVA